MTLPQFLFIAIDKLFDRGQNEKKMLKLKEVPFEIEKDIVYDESCDSCKLDTYFVPKAEGEKYPVFFYIHGGGFVAGDKHYRRGVARWAASKGFFVVNVNYGLGPQYKFPTAILHCVSALNWVCENASKYNLDLDNMCVSGDSAGGYAAAMLSCITTNEELQAKLGVKTTCKFKAAILDCGIYDIEAALAQKMPFNLTDKVLFDFCGIHVKDLPQYEHLDVLAPFGYVNENFPASFITYAQKDMFCKGQGEKLVAKLQEKGVHVESDHSTKLLDNHCYPLNWTTKAAAKNVKLVEDFMARLLAKEN